MEQSLYKDQSLPNDLQIRRQLKRCIYTYIYGHLERGKHHLVKVIIFTYICVRMRIPTKGDTDQYLHHFYPVVGHYKTGRINYFRAGLQPLVPGSWDTRDTISLQYNNLFTGPAWCSFLHAHINVRFFNTGCRTCMHRHLV